VVELTTNAVLSRTGVALALLAIGPERNGDPLPHNSRVCSTHDDHGSVPAQSVAPAGASTAADATRTGAMLTT
jgi:hypothetical protein